jgi:hypothetical protein
MAALRPEEEWARQMLSSALDAPVVQHDDGSAPSMYDLRVDYLDRPPAAVEVTSAADGETIALWNLMNGNGRWIEDDLVGGWTVSLDVAARAKRVRSELPGLLASLERSGSQSFRRRTHGQADDVCRQARSIGVVSAQQSGTDFPGSIYITIELPLGRSAGWVSDDGDALSEWIGSFLALPEQADVRAKLGRSGATERHAFVLLPGFSTAPFNTAELLMREDPPLPRIAPHLPPEVTDAWIASFWSTGVGIRWSDDQGWSTFDKP